MDLHYKVTDLPGHVQPVPGRVPVMWCHVLLLMATPRILWQVGSSNSVAVVRRDRVQALLRSLCCGVGDPELLSAVSGLLSGSAAVRAAALLALPAVPTLAEGVPPESVEVLTVLALAQHDVDEENAAAAHTLWQQVTILQPAA